MDIQRKQVITKNGHILELFYNPDNNLVVLDYIAENESGGNELYRGKLKPSLLDHLTCKT